MAGPFGEAGNEYWDRRINTALSGIKNRPANPAKGSGATIGSAPLDFSKIDFSQFGQDKEVEPVEPEKGALQKIVEAPVIKQLLDAVSVFNYAGANIANNMVDSAEQGKGPGDYIGDVFEGIGQGVAGAVGNDDYTRGYGDVIRRVQTNAGIDTESTSAKWVSGLGGFAGDVLLDPTTYLGIGGIKAIAGGVKGVSGLSKANKVNADMLSKFKNSEGVSNVLKSVPGKYTPAVADKVSSIRKFRGDANIKLPDSTSPLSFDSVRPSRKATKIEEVELKFKAENPGAVVRQAAVGKGEAFRAGFATSMQKYRLEERARKINGKEKRAARRAMRDNPDLAINTLLKVPYEELSSVALTIAPSAGIRMAENIIRTSDEMLAIERAPDEVTAAAADMFETIKEQSQVGNSIADTVDFFVKQANPGANVIGVHGRKATIPNEVLKREDTRRIVVGRAMANRKRDAVRREAARQGNDPKLAVFGTTDETIESGTALQRVESEKAIIETDAMKPGAVSPQEVQRTAEEVTDYADELASNPFEYLQMRVRSVKEQNAIDTAFIMAKAALPRGATTAGKSEFFYPRAVIDIANRLANSKATTGVIMARYAELKEGTASVHSLQGMTRILNSRDKAAIQELRDRDPVLVQAFELAKGGAPELLYLNIGIVPSDIKFAQLGELRAVDGSDFTGNMATIIKNIRNLASGPNAEKKFRMEESHPLWTTVHELEAVFGVTGPREVALALSKVDTKSPLWQNAVKFSYGARVPKSAMRGITETVGEDYIKASLKLVPTEETAKVVTRMRDLDKSRIDELRPGFSAVIDDIILNTVKYQATAKGKKVTAVKKATTEGENLGARINHDWNTHASMTAYAKIQREIYNLYKGGELYDFKSRDALQMSSLRYFENTLRANNVDFHLTNMAEPFTYTRKFSKPDGTIGRVVVENGQYSVRLGLSDVYGAMSHDMRARFALGGKMVLNPSQFTDLGEALVRSARELDPLTGGVNLERAKILTRLAVMGERGQNRVVFPDNSTRLIDPATDDVRELVKSGARIMYREMGTSLDSESRLNIIRIAVTRYLKDSNGKKLLKQSEIDSLFAKVQVEKGGKNIWRTDPDEVLKKLAVKLDGEIDGDSLIDSAISQVRTTIYDDLIESFFVVGSDGRIPFNTLVETAISNSMLAGKFITDRASKMAVEDFQRVITALESGNTAKLIEAVGTEAKGIKGLPIEGQKLVTSAKAEELAKVMPEAAINHLKTQANIATKVTPENASKMRTEMSNAVPVDDSIRATTGKETVDEKAVIMENYFDATVAEISTVHASILGRALNPTLGMDQSANLVTKTTHTMSTLMDSNTRQFKAWEKKGIRGPQIATALATIRKTVANGADPSNLAGIDKEIFDYFNLLFDTSKYNFFKANGIEGAAMNRFKHNMEQSFDRSTAKKMTDFDEDNVDNFSKLWTQLPVEDPYSFVSKLFYVYGKTAQETAIAGDFSKRFGQAMSPERAKELGFVKVIDSGNKNILARMIDTELYYPKELADELPFIHRMMDANRSVVNKDLRNFMENVWDPVVSILKMGQTSIKPGHHVMSVVGDWWRNLMMTGSPMTREYKQSAHLVFAIRAARKNEAPVDAMTRRLDGYLEYEGKHLSTSANNEDFLTLMLNTPSGGSKVATKVPVQDLITLGEKHGVFFAPHSGGVSEDLLSGASAGIEGGRGTKVFKRAADAVLDNPLTGAINAFSADRDGFSRGALFLYYMQSRKFKSLEDAAEYAGAQVRKAAPVAADLAAWESKVLRRGVFYYTWLRGITPRIVETLITRPGLAMIPSKGMYELAGANGLDPNSFGDPMSDEVKSSLPDYYQERVMGPAWQDSQTGEYWGFSPTSPTMDVLNTFGSNVSLNDIWQSPMDTSDNAAQKMGKTFIGMVTPWVKYPVEMATGMRMDTGAPIESNLQYLQDQNAVSRTISKISGKNIDGLNRTESRYRNGMEEPGELIGTELVNFFGSPQLTNYSADNVIKAGEFQKKQEQIDINKLLERMGQAPPE